MCEEKGEPERESNRGPSAQDASTTDTFLGGNHFLTLENAILICAIFKHYSWKNFHQKHVLCQLVFEILKVKGGWV